MHVVMQWILWIERDSRQERRAKQGEKGKGVVVSVEQTTEDGRQRAKVKSKKAKGECSILVAK
jgi:hypothetical protein